MNRNLRPRKFAWENIPTANAKRNPKNSPKKQALTKNESKEINSEPPSKSKTDYAAILPSKEVLAERKKRWEELFERFSINDESDAVDMDGDDDCELENDDANQSKHFKSNVANVDLNGKVDNEWDESECEEGPDEDDTDFDPSAVYKSLLPVIKKQTHGEHYDIWHMRDHDSLIFRKKKPDGSEVSIECNKTREQSFKKDICTRSPTQAGPEIVRRHTADAEATVKMLTSCDQPYVEYEIEERHEETIKLVTKIRRMRFSIDGGRPTLTNSRENIEYIDKELRPRAQRCLSFDKTNSSLKDTSGNGAGNDDDEAFPSVDGSLIAGILLDTAPLLAVGSPSARIRTPKNILYRFATASPVTEEDSTALADITDEASIALAEATEEESAALADITDEASIDLAEATDEAPTTVDFIGKYTIEQVGNFIELKMYGAVSQVVTPAMVRKIDSRFSVGNYAYEIDEKTHLSLRKRLKTPKKKSPLHDQIITMREKDFQSAYFEGGLE